MPDDDRIPFLEALGTRMSSWSMRASTAKVLGWVLVGLISIPLALSVTEQFGPFENLQRVTATVIITVAATAFAWEIYHRPWESRREQAQRLTEKAVAICDRNHERAMVLFSQAVALHPNERTNLNLAAVLDRMGHRDLAWQYFSAANKPGARDQQAAGEAALALARICLADRDWEWADEYAREALGRLSMSSHEDRAHAHITRGMAQWQKGAPECASEQLDAALALNIGVELQRTARAIKSGITIGDFALYEQGEWLPDVPPYRRPETLN